mmetsp:Transcript_28950/g.84858  ORF Transcript_28950/g.84858 Transcript_28950/m.84858 type:complete len:137 (-) Transcript_28950:409-819(-)
MIFSGYRKLCGGRRTWRQTEVRLRSPELKTDASSVRQQSDMADNAPNNKDTTDERSTLAQMKTAAAEGIAKGADIVAGGAQIVKEKMVGEEKEDKTLGDKAAEVKETAAAKVEEGKDAAATRIAEGADAVKSAVGK